jgi:hypothetical protein
LPPLPNPGNPKKAVLHEFYAAQIFHFAGFPGDRSRLGLVVMAFPARAIFFSEIGWDAD